MPSLSASMFTWPSDAFSANSFNGGLTLTGFIADLFQSIPFTVTTSINAESQKKSGSFFCFFTSLASEGRIKAAARTRFFVFFIAAASALSVFFPSLSLNIISRPVTLGLSFEILLISLAITSLFQGHLPISFMLFSSTLIITISLAAGCCLKRLFK